jgi:hypothetical protein
MSFGVKKEEIMLSREFLGVDLELAWAKFCGGTVIGGLNDGGYDIATTDVQLPKFQVKGSWTFAEKFLAISLKPYNLGNFIPICIGEPPEYNSETREREWAKVRETIRRFGGYVAHGIPKRDVLLERINRVRAYHQTCLVTR